jgi:hypothetical protein
MTIMREMNAISKRPRRSAALVMIASIKTGAIIHKRARL